MGDDDGGAIDASDAGSGDTHQPDAEIDASIDARIDDALSDMRGVIDAEVGPCTDIDIGRATMQPAELVPETDDYVITVPFAELHARFRGVAADGRTCEHRTEPRNGIEIGPDGFFLPVDGGEIEYLGDTFTVRIADPVQRDRVQATQGFTDFGFSISANEDLVAVGAPRDRRDLIGVSPLPDDSDAERLRGAVYLFRIVGDQLTAEAFMQSAEGTFDGALNLGWEVQLREGLIVALARNYSTGPSEFGRLFAFGLGPDGWEPRGVVERPTSNGRFEHGRSDGTSIYAAVPQFLGGMAIRGIVRRYGHTAPSWDPDGDLSLADPAADDGFGKRLEIAGDVMLVEQMVAPANPEGANLHLLGYDGERWNLVAAMPFRSDLPNPALPDPTLPNPGLFATDGTWAAVTDDSSTKIYRVDDARFDERGEGDISNFRGRSVSILAGRLVVGTPELEGDVPLRGSVTAFVMQWDPVGGVESRGAVEWVGRPIPQEPETEGGLFGAAVALTPSSGLIVGAPVESRPGFSPSGHGGVYLFQ